MGWGAAGEDRVSGQRPLSCESTVGVEDRSSKCVSMSPPTLPCLWEIFQSPGHSFLLSFDVASVSRRHSRQPLGTSGSWQVVEIMHPFQSSKRTIRGASLVAQ